MPHSETAFFVLLKGTISLVSQKVPNGVLRETTVDRGGCGPTQTPESLSIHALYSLSGDESSGHEVFFYIFISHSVGYIIGSN